MVWCLPPRIDVSSYSHMYLVDVGILPGIGQDVECRVEYVQHPNDFHDSVRIRITSAKVADNVLTINKLSGLSRMLYNL